MNINEIEEILKSSSVKLLSSGRNPMFIISFFIQTFSDDTVISEDRLLIKLTDFIESKDIETDEEYLQRVERAAQLTAEKGLDVLVANSNEADYANVRYFSKRFKSGYFQ